LYTECVRVLTVCQPKAFLFENVPALAQLDGGWRAIEGADQWRNRIPSQHGAVAGGVLSTMLRAFAGAGYDVHWHLLDSRRWVAQKRLRLYIIGFRHDLHVSGFVPPCEFGPLTLGGAVATAEDTKPPALVVAMPPHEGGRPPPPPPMPPPPMPPSPVDAEAAARGSRGRWSAAGATGATDAAGGAARGWPVLRSCLEPKDSAAVLQCVLTTAQWEKIRSEAFCTKSMRTVELRELLPDEPAPTLISSYHRVASLTSKYVLEEADGSRRELPRFLTPRESARVMGFPESFTWPQPHARKRTCQHAFGEGHIYRQLGNAVCPPVVHAIAEQMLLAMGMAPCTAALGAQEILNTPLWGMTHAQLHLEHRRS
jgi:site-specific DNA-cytosine methylase